MSDLGAPTTYLFNGPCVQLVETLHDVGLVQPGTAVLRDGVEEVISEQFQHVPIARFGPRDVQVKSDETKNVRMYAINGPRSSKKLTRVVR